MRFISRALSVIFLVSARLFADWPQFLGPDGQGHFDAEGVPLHWNEVTVTWKTAELEFATLQGRASSPILHGKLLILCCDGADKQFLVALDKRSGEIKCKTPRQHLEAAAKKAPSPRWCTRLPSSASSTAPHSW